MLRIFCIASLACVSLVSSAVDLLPPGNRPLPPSVHALTGAKIVVSPERTIESGTVIIRDGKIETVGTDVAVPPDARVWDLTGCTVYAGFIDPYLALKSEVTDDASSEDHEHLGSGALDFYGVAKGDQDSGRAGPKHEISRMTPEYRVVDGYVPDSKLLEELHGLGFTAANVVPETGILRGTSALVLLQSGKPNDAILNPEVFQHAVFDGGNRRGVYPSSLMGIIAALRQTFLDAEHHAQVWAAHRTATNSSRYHPEFNVSLDALNPLLKKERSIVFEPKSALMIDAAARLGREFGLDYLILATGEEWRRPELAKSAGVPFIVPLRYPEVPKLSEPEDWDAVSLDQLRRWDWAPENPLLLRQQGIEIALTTYGLENRKDFRKKLRLAIDRGLSEADALAALTTIPARLCGGEDRLGTVEAGKNASLVIVAGGGYFDPDSKVREVWVDGRVYRVEHSEKRGNEKSKSDEQDRADSGNQEKSRSALKERVARSPQDGRGPLATPKAVWIRGATLWTCGPEGRVRADLLAVDGKIARIGSEANPKAAGLAEDEVLVIDGNGKHVTPGLIDAHSHAMILGGVNESTLPSTAMVRISDVVNSETENIYRQLAGGLTVANLLHGSANPIGGQNCIIKLKEGAVAEDLKMPDAPPGIKFALGENVKQANWGERYVTRFPQSRMGVRTFIENRFTAAQHYLEAWAEYDRNGGARPRRNLELEALGEILKQSRWIHCHSYRQDEILVFLRLMEQFGVQVGTLQHVLEGYKVADEIAAHGAGASCFSDWWAYKFEVYDAIPYAGSLMRDRGVLVSFNSDDGDLARRLHMEAAKAVKYGGTPEEEALQFVTINPAKQLRIDHRVGSLQPGKDADFVLWSKSPLDSATVCLETWIEGKKYFDRTLDEIRTRQRNQERDALIEKARRASDRKPKNSQPSQEEQHFFERSLEHRHDHATRHCMDE